MQNTGVLNSKYQIEPDEGLLVFMHSGLLAEVFLLLLSPDIRSVVINRIFPDKASVMVDNRQGMYEIFNHLVDRKCRKVIFAGRFPESQSQVNESEHFNNFLHEVNIRNIEYSTVVSGNFNELLTITEQKNPDAIIFSGDDAALLFKKLAQDRLKSIPYLVGFGDIAVREAGIESLTTYHIDCEAMGVAAVEQLLEHKDSFSKPLNRRVPGKLIIRE
jgi:DNA-binding LacI/PurR family transcriptional regulator